MTTPIDPMNPFTGADFEKLNNLPKSFPLSWDAIAEIANARFRELMASCPKVYGGGPQNIWIKNILQGANPTHEATLWNPREIEKST